MTKQFYIDALAWGTGLWAIGYVLGVVWTLIAVVFDYVFLVKVFKPADGYYKLDVYVYYALTFLLPVLVGAKKTLSKK